MFLFESIEQSKMYNCYADLPSLISSNLNPEMKIRPYQEAAFRNYVTYYENENLRRNGNRTLFHMATGSGKTYIMAGLILYLYQKGYRNFLFFVPSSNIKSKTIANFTEPSSSKYLFADSIVIDGEIVKIRKVNSFCDSSDDSINICFTTIQQIHTDYWTVKENGISFDDYKDLKVVFISDEAHHLTVDTAGKQDKSLDESRSWEYVAKRLYTANPDNIMLEFTATCRLDNPSIREEYENKIVYDYDLKRFRHDRYSKEVQTFQTNLDYLEMCLQALVLSQFRLHLFNDLKQDIKPVILFKSSTIADSRSFAESFGRMLDSLTGDTLMALADTEAKPLQAAFQYFKDKGISLDLLSRELKEGFSETHCIEVNNDSALKSNDIILNTLEDPDNPIRAIFEVKALDEGWDVLNLFDIVRLYDTRDAKNGIPGKKTVSEAQLIGRGARYCPFVYDDPGEKYIRKFDEDLENKYRICEEMYYHCHTNSRYIIELHKALVDTGMMDANVIVKTLKLKDSFKNSRLYRSGSVLVNNQLEVGSAGSDSLPPNIRSRPYSYHVPDRTATVSTILAESNPILSVSEPTIYTYTVKEISELNYNTVHTAVRRYSKFRFSNLRKYYPGLSSIREFITSSDFLGEIRIDISTSGEPPSQEDMLNACIRMADKVSSALGDFEKLFVGTNEFRLVPFKDLFYDKVVNYPDTGTELGMPQSESSCWRLDLSDKDWYAFNENYGTGEEKGFVKYFSQRIKLLQDNYDEVYLVRNERHMHIYSFEGGCRFEPDFLLFLIKDDEPVDQLQVFIEPKGTNLLEMDRWKQDFMLDMAEQWKIDSRTIVDDTMFRLVGMPFYNNDNNDDFDKAFDNLK